MALRLGLSERTARTEILEQSTSAPRILSADVADAIEALVGPPERRSLPVVFDKNAVVQKLIKIARTDEDGIVHEQTAIAARSMTETFLNRLSGACTHKSTVRQSLIDVRLGPQAAQKRTLPNRRFVPQAEAGQTPILLAKSRCGSLTPVMTFERSPTP